MSTTKIILDHPYDKDWKFGYLVVNPEGRRTVILYNSHKNRSSTQYARYLLAVKAGRYLSPEEEADHIDDDKTNDDLDNLQILSSDMNRLKQNNRIKRNRMISETLSKVELVCPTCNNKFVLPASTVKSRKKSGISVISCSRSCSSSAAYIRKTQNPNKVINANRLREQGWSYQKIAEELGMSKNTAMKYCKM